MLDFSGNDQKTKLIAIHYAQSLGNGSVLQLLQNDGSVGEAKHAKSLTEFYWAMLDQSVQDKENNVVVLGEPDLQYWMERLLNIIGGYLEGVGYGEVWEQVCDDA